IMGTIKGVLDAVAAVAGDRGRGTGDRGRSCAEGRPPAPVPCPPTPVPYAARPYLVALDIPTGLNADTGEADLACFAADLTVALGFPKVGMFLFPGAANVGTLITRSIGLPDQLAADIKTGLLNANCVRNLLPPRLANANKGTFGKVLVVGGSINYVGAPCLAALAAIRTGAGLVTLATCSSLQPVAAAKLTEATFLPLPEVAGCRALGEAAAAVVGEALAGYNTLLIGCGLGRHPETAEFVRTVLRACPPWVSVVVDADGLNALSEKEDWWEDIACPLVLTPHPGEMARLTGHTVGEVNGRRLDLARQFSAKWRKVVVLKGANTVVVSPGGEVNINHAANPALATAGVGDVLAGVIAGLLAQGLSTWDAASAGVYIHGEAGAALSRELGEAGLLASELASAVPRVLKSLRETQLGP
ncbi:MAG: NAD(P)H-hydrate dehydratase, partial [Dehalococcoidia bacterium]|nr:NAD(P)H-hydrate dehydratase [Dehalococcoidia bacterium]